MRRSLVTAAAAVLTCLLLAAPAQAKSFKNCIRNTLPSTYPAGADHSKWGGTNNKVIFIASCRTTSSFSVGSGVDTGGWNDYGTAVQGQYVNYQLVNSGGTSCLPVSNKHIDSCKLNIRVLKNNNQLIVENNPQVCLQAINTSEGIVVKTDAAGNPTCMKETW